MPNWRPGDTIHLGRRTLRVIRVRDDDADQPPVLVVETRRDEPTARIFGQRDLTEWRRLTACLRGT